MSGEMSGNRTAANATALSALLFSAPSCRFTDAVLPSPGRHLALPFVISGTPYGGGGSGALGAGSARTLGTPSRLNSGRGVSFRIARRGGGGAKTRAPSPAQVHPTRFFPQRRRKFFSPKVRVLAAGTTDNG